ncbi:MAG: S8 family serine peptidase [Actinomycetota bacterium]|nr:S8 family serine peptidase [Actinomycetota bacterium]
MRRLLAVAALALASAGIAAGAEVLAPNDPLVPQQWYLARDRVFEAGVPPSSPPVRVAVIDSGIDGRHPELAGKIAAAKSFVGGSPLEDSDGHGTFVAGQIAAAWDERGTAGMAPSVRLLVAKVVRRDGTILTRDEARAIRWAVAQGARVINLSFSIPRNPRARGWHTYSAREARAIAYAVRRNVVVVAAVGNSGDVPGSPPVWNYAGYPAALPHVLGVGALARDGSVPSFSNRDARFADIAAPGDEIVSTLPSTLTRQFPSCAEQGYSLCGPSSYRRGAGTSFAAPQVSAAAALLATVRPELRADQITTLLERNAVDARAETGCTRCPNGRDALTGWGQLDISAAIAAARSGSVPAADRYESNDDAGSAAWALSARVRDVSATLDYWDDPIDVYRIRLRAGTQLRAMLRGSAEAVTTLSLWRPATTRIARSRKPLLRASAVRGVARLRYRARRAGSYYLAVERASLGSGPYALQVVR